MSFGLSFGLAGRSAGASAVFDPATLALSGWWRADYSGAPWAGTASAGLSNGRDLKTNGNDPSNGTTQNSKTPADFDGTNDNLINNDLDATDFWTTTAGTIICLFIADAAATHSGFIYDDVALIRDANADFGMTYTDSGVLMFAYDGGYQYAVKAASTGSYHLAMGRVDGSTIGITVDSNTEVTNSCGTLAVLTGGLAVGASYAGSNGYFNGRILELMTSKLTLTNTDYGNIKSYVNSRYALAL